MAVAMAGLASTVIPWLVPGFAPEALELTVELTRIQAIGLIGASCFTVLTCFFQSESRFLWAALASLLCGCIGWLLLVVYLGYGGVRFAAWIQVFVLCGPTILLVPCLGQRPKFRWTENLHRVRKLWARFAPLLGSSVYIRSGFVIDRFLTSFLDQGSLVMLELVWRMLLALVRILNQGIVTPILPRLSVLAGQGAWGEFSEILYSRLKWIGGISALLLLSLSLLPSVMQGEEFWAALSRTLGGAIVPENIRSLWVIFLCGSGVLLCGGLHNMLSTAFYTDRETSLPARVEMVTYTLGLVMKGIGVVEGGLVGLAIAISISYVLTTIVLAAFLFKRLKACRLLETSIKWNLPSSRKGATIVLLGLIVLQS